MGETLGGVGEIDKWPGFGNDIYSTWM